jgi:hypothetical protein
MAKAQGTLVVSQTAWWLGEGDEECPHCSHYYFLEVEVRCTECDAPSCPQCRVRHKEGHFVCPDCVETGAHG